MRKYRITVSVPDNLSNVLGDDIGLIRVVTNNLLFLLAENEKDDIFDAVKSVLRKEDWCKKSIKTKTETETSKHLSNLLSIAEEF